MGGKGGGEGAEREGKGNGGEEREMGMEGKRGGVQYEFSVILGSE